MNGWLESFAYRTNLSWWILMTSALAALLVSILTVSWQSYIAARKNPVESLRYE
jgi:putative ABC transport system permease protein